MSQPTITTKLVRGGHVVPAGPSVPLGSDGTTLEISAPAGLELVDAALTLQVPDDSAPVELLTDAAITSSTGAWPEAASVTWVVCDWRARRALVRLVVTVNSLQTTTHLRLRVSDGGPWVLASPTALVPLAAGANTIRLPGLAAARLMIELVKAPAGPIFSAEDYVAAGSTLTSLALPGSRRPPGFTVSVAPAVVVQHEPALLPPAASITLRESLLAALRKALPLGVGGTAQIVVRAPVACELRRLALTLGARASLLRWPGDRATLTLPVVSQVAAVATLPLDAHPTSFAVRVVADLRPELPPSVPPPPVKAGHAHRCAPDSALAQSFRFAGACSLVGVDLWLAVRTKALRGKLVIYADEHGGPGEAPLASVDLELVAAITGVLALPTWVPVDLAEALDCPPDRPIWVALVVDEGEALWVLAPRAVDGPAQGLLRRERGAAWVPRDMSFPTGPTDLWAVASPRLRNDGPALAPTLRLRRGNTSVAVVAGADGFVRLDAAGLAPLNVGAVDLPLELVIVSPSAGSVELRELHVDLPAQSATWAFGSAP